MRIALVINSFNAADGGAEHWTWQFGQALLADGHEVHVAASRFDAGTEAAGFVAHRVPPLNNPLHWAAAAADIVKPLAVDVVHDMGHGWHCDVFQPHGGSRIAAFEQNLLLLPAWLRPLKRATARVAPRYRQIARLVQQQYADDGRRFIALSKMVAGHMRSLHGLSGGSLRQVYNGVDLDRFSPGRVNDHRRAVRRRLGVRDELLLLIVAHNFALKGVPGLLRAVGRLLDRGEKVHLAIAGGHRAARYRWIARRAGAAQAVTFLGPQQDVVPFYSAADAYLQPTFYDPCSLVVLEALAMGLPVITSRFNGAGELMTEGREGFILSDPGDAEAIADCIAALRDDELRAAMSGRARALAEQHSLERNLAELLAVYEESARRRRRAA